MGLTAIAGGLLRTVASFAPMGIESDVWRERLYVVVDVFLIAGLIGFYASRRRSVGRAGTCGFVAALGGFTIVRVSRAVSLLDLYPIGSLAIVCGLIAVTAASWRARQSAAWTPFAFSASLILGVVGNFVSGASGLFVLSGIVFGVAYAGMGWTLWSDAQHRPGDMTTG